MKLNKAFKSTCKTLDWLIVAAALTVIFIVFEMQAYTIPTGSMADTLRGAHFRLRCGQCGYRYEYGFLPEYYRMPPNSTPWFDVSIPPLACRCPSCGFYRPADQKVPVVKGDRIFVLKCIYQFAEPKRWDVVVFKNPLDPTENYIKRLIAKPHETVELIDGDVYINGQISRKPPRVQAELWMPVYDNDYQPVNPEEGIFNGHNWRQPFRNLKGSTWNLNAEGPTVFSLDSSSEQVNTIFYDTNLGNDFKATYAYDLTREYPTMPICSDLMVRFYVGPDSKGTIGAALSKYGVMYKASVNLSGQMVIERIEANGLVKTLNSKSCREFSDVLPLRFRFANVDHQLVLEFGNEKLEYDLGLTRDDAGEQKTNIMPRMAIFGAGKISIEHIAIFRDIHYMDAMGRGKARILRAGAGDPFELNKDEFFVCGDNSPASLDGRLWPAEGIANSGKKYRAGIVPRDYLVGKAFFVYWPGAQKPLNKFKIIPYLGGMKTIPGGRSSFEF